MSPSDVVFLAVASARAASRRVGSSCSAQMVLHDQLRWGPLPSDGSYPAPMTAQRVRVSAAVVAWATAATLMTVGCSGSAGSDSPGSRAKAHAAASSASPGPSKPSPFCDELTRFHLGLTSYRGDLADAVHSQRMDLKKLQQEAASTIRLGDGVQASAPPAIAKEFRAALGALKTSSSKLKPDSRMSDVTEPVFNKKIQPSFDVLEKYFLDCNNTNE